MKSTSRRNFLQSVGGAMVALPWLESVANADAGASVAKRDTQTDANTRDAKSERGTLADFLMEYWQLLRPDGGILLVGV